MPRKHYISYSFLTMGGRRFVELTPERFAKLNKKEQANIEVAARYTGVDIRFFNKEDWKQVFSAPNADKTLWNIITGKVAQEAIDTLSANYAKGLDWMGRHDLSIRFIALYNNLKDSAYADMINQLIEELPQLNLYYKDKGRSHTKRQETFSQEVAEDQIEAFESVLSSYETEWDMLNER